MGNFSEKTPDINDMICPIDHNIHQMWFPVVYVVVFVVGLPANFLSLYYGYLQIKAKNELGIYLCNLTMADLLYIFSLPFWLQYVLQHDNWTYNELMCKICGILLYENIYISIGFLCCISIDRYLAVVHPFRFHGLRTMKAAIIVSAVIWSKEFLTSFFFFKHGEVTKDPESHVVCFEHYPIKSWEHTINYYRFFAGFLFPICLVLFSYCCILIVVRKSHGTQAKKKNQIKQLVLSTIIIFLVCFGPYHVLVVVRSLFETNCAFAAKIFNVYHFSLSLTSFNCIADPVLYCFASESTYKDFIKMRNCFLRSLRCSKINTQESFELNTPEIFRSSGELADKETDVLNKQQVSSTVYSVEGTESPTSSLDKL